MHPQTFLLTIFAILPFTLASPIPKPLIDLTPHILSRQLVKDIGYSNPGGEGDMFTPIPPPPPSPPSNPDPNNGVVGPGPQEGSDNDVTPDPGAPQQEGGKNGGATAASAGRAGHP